MVIAALISSVLLILLDQGVKYWVVQSFTAPVPPYVTTTDAAKPFLPGLVELTRVHNDGAAWSSFSGMRWLLIGVSSVMVIALVILLCKKIVRHPVGLWACTLIIAGGIGNLIDRFRLGYVVDMLNLQFMDFPVFNVADCCVTVGAILGVIYYIWFMKYDEKKETGHGETNS